MTLKARVVLDDCREAIKDLPDGVQGSEWRRRWLAALALLRAVGHVLRNVDAVQNPELKRVIDEQWQGLQDTKPEPTIFWRFIESDRNFALKEYGFHAGVGVTIDLDKGAVIHKYPMNDGPFSARDQRDVLNEAVQWWESYLKRVESERGNVNTAAIPAERYQTQAFKLGLQYLVAGRFAAASHCLPVSANLLHHAIEMFLKGCLVQHVGFQSLPRGRDGHVLTVLWKKFRHHFSDPSLDRFKSIVEDLHRFERIRYPEELIREGGLLGVGFPSGMRHEQRSDPKLPEYQIAVEDVDALVHALFTLSTINPEAFRWLLEQEHAGTYFRFCNKTPLI